jgi:hypothetical protein
VANTIPRNYLKMKLPLLWASAQQCSKSKADVRNWTSLSRFVCIRNRLRAAHEEAGSNPQVRFAYDPPQSDIGSCKAVLVLFPETITHAHNGIDLFLSESRQEIPSN